jgi:putative membrane protein
MKKTLLIFSISLLVCFAAMAQTMVGKMRVSEFKALNAQGAKLVKAIKPTKMALSTADNNLFMQVAMGGKKQLLISQAVLDKATNPQVKLLAQSEVEEQTTIAAKLAQIATAKGVTLPTEADPTADALLSQLGTLTGTELDAFYIAESGIKGHQELQATMTTVNKTAKDLALKSLAVATLPVIRVHLKVSQDQQKMMNTSGGTATK